MRKTGAGVAVLFVLASTLGLGPGLARAQVAADPTLMVLAPIGVDAGTAAQIEGALVQVGQAGGYHVVTPGAGSVIGSLDPLTGTDLLAIVQRTGLHRAVAVWVVQMGAGYDVHVGLASADAIAASLHVMAGPTDLAGASARALAALLPAPFATATGAWGGIAASSAPALTAPSAPATITVPASAVPLAMPASVPADASPEPRRRHDRPTGLLIGGAAMLGGGWVAGFAIGLFGGYHDRTCWWSCSGLGPGTSWDPDWDAFRATSLIPVVGPWVQWAVKPPGDDGWPIWLALDGLLQGAGLIMLIVGIVVHDAAPEGDEEATVVLLPSAGPDHAGLTAVGRF